MRPLRMGREESSEVGVLGQRERGCVREGIKPLFFFLLWLLLLLQPFPYPRSFLPGAVEAMGIWNVFTEAAPSESPPLSHRKGRHCSFPPFTGPFSLTDQSCLTLAPSPAACKGRLWPKEARNHPTSARMSLLENGECSFSFSAPALLLYLQGWREQ